MSDQVSTSTVKLTSPFNHRRLLGPIGHIPPAEAEARHHEQLEDAAMAA